MKKVAALALVATLSVTKPATAQDVAGSSTNLSWLIPLVIIAAIVVAADDSDSSSMYSTATME